MGTIITVIVFFLAFIVFGMIVQGHVKEKNKKITEAAIEIKKSVAILDNNMTKLREATLSMVDMMVEIIGTNDITFSLKFKDILKKANEDIRKDDEDGTKI